MKDLATKVKQWTRKDLIGLEYLSRDEIELILDTAESFRAGPDRSIRKVPALRGQVVVNLFFENSTRTSNSFAIAAKRLSADVVNFSTSTSSVSKGETLVDTAKNILAMGADAFVMRHQASGAASFLANHVDVPVINAGDGQHEHPTQGLLDIFTIRDVFRSRGRANLEGLNVAIMGDIRHSRVARSNAWGLIKLGANVTFVGPKTLIPRGIESMGVKVSNDLDSVLKTADVINMLRIQYERRAGDYFPSAGEFSSIWGINSQRLKIAKPDIVIMHPGPINRGIEISAEVADSPNSVILQQVTNGVIVRMAVLYLTMGRKLTGAFDSAALTDGAE
ncbi:MAG: aspartate carbamoyltransferase catalytic subunit [Planctomycetota bacterium]